jgi:hypothetical protein
MKVKGPLFAGMLAALLLIAAVAQAQPTKISFTWNYAATPSVPVCTTSLVTNCVNSFILTEPVTGITKTIPAVAGTTSYSFDLTPLPPAGTYTYSLVASEVYAGGTLVSAPMTTTVTVPKTPDSVTGFTCVVK